MNKKTYLIPQITVVTVEPQLMNSVSYSGQSTKAGDPSVGGIDNTNNDNRSRMANEWADEEEEDW